MSNTGRLRSDRLSRISPDSAAGSSPTTSDGTPRPSPSGPIRTAPTERVMATVPLQTGSRDPNTTSKNTLNIRLDEVEILARQTFREFVLV